MLTVKLSRAFYLLPALCFMSDRKSFPTHQRKIDSVSSSSRKPHFKQTRQIEEQRTINQVVFLFKQREANKLISANFSDTSPPNNENNLCKSKPQYTSSKLKFIIEDLITIGLHPQVKNSTLSAFSFNNLKEISSRYT